MQQILSTDSETIARQKRNYHDLILNNYADRAAVSRADDELAHIEDTALFWTSANGRPTQLTWNQMTDEQRDMQRQADQRAYELSLFDPCDWEGVR